MEKPESTKELLAKEKNLFDFKKKLKVLINRHNIDTYTSTPDFMLAEYVLKMIMDYEATMNKNIEWHSGWEK